MHVEPTVKWPDLNKPVIITRDLSISLPKKRVVVKEGLQLIVLVNGSLYQVVKDAGEVLAGYILSRNRERARQHNLKESDPAQHLFTMYTSLYDARRGIAPIRPTYDECEIPEMLEWCEDAHTLMKLSWRMCELNDERDTRFAVIAESRVSKHRRDLAEMKKQARGKFTQAATLKDKEGRRNVNAIPLRLFAADNRLEQRIMDVRGMGRNMDWRAVVLDHYIVQLLKECKRIQRVAGEALSSNALKPGQRTKADLQPRIGKFKAEKELLLSRTVRPFHRSQWRAAQEFGEAAQYLELALEHRDPGYVEKAELELNRVYESMELAHQHWWLQELLLVVARHERTKTSFSDDRVTRTKQQLDKIESALTDLNPHTQKPMGQSMVFNLIPSVLHQLVRVRGKLNEKVATPLDLRAIHEILEEICKPL